MAATVVSVLPSRSVKDVAKLLLRARISAVPVVDDSGALLGIVSEGDLPGRSAEDRLSIRNGSGLGPADTRRHAGAGRDRRGVGSAF